MPEQDGLSTIMELRRIAPDVRIIAMSGGMVQNPELYLQLAEKLGADRVLRKPFLLEELLGLIAEVLALPRPPAP
jgi:CheY-like chemotaxis protein